jgi:hypothetical protein
MFPAGFEPAVSLGERPQTYVIAREATATSAVSFVLCTKSQSSERTKDSNMGAWRHGGYEKCTQNFKEEPIEERLLKRHRQQATNRDREVLYFTKLLIARSMLFPCLMEEICKWSAGGVKLAEK